MQPAWTGDGTVSNERGVLVQELINDLGLVPLNKSADHNRLITTMDINRPGLALAGYFRYHPAGRIQLMGRTELSLLNGMEERELNLRMFAFCSYEQTPCVIVSRGLTPPAALLEQSEARGLPILSTNMVTTRAAAVISTFLEERLAPETMMHGVLVDVYGIGIILTGSSGIGKSETALELIKRGHRLVADDAVMIRQIADNTLVGSTPPLLKYLLEIRGLGVLNAMTLFGAGAVRTHKKLNLVIHLEAWRDDVAYDRLGIDENTVRILDVDLPSITVPVRPGRNLAVIIEVAAMNHRLKRMGFHAAREFTDQLERAVQDQDEYD